MMHTAAIGRIITEKLNGALGREDQASNQQVELHILLFLEALEENLLLKLV